MEFGVFSLAGVKRDPVTGVTPTEGERIDAIQTIARRADELGLDVFALGERHKPHHVGSAPAVLLAAIAAQTRQISLSTTSTLISINDPVRLAEEYATLQHLCHGRLDIALGRSDTVAPSPWSAPELDLALDLALENYHLLYRLWREEGVDWEGEFRAPLIDFTSTPRPLDGVPPYVWHTTSRFPEIADQAGFYGDGFFVSNLIAPMRRFAGLVADYRRAFEGYGHGRAEEAIVGLGGHVFVAKNSQDAMEEFRPYFDASEVFAGLSLEEAVAGTSLAVGSSQQVIEKVLSFRETYGDYQRQLFWIDQAGLPLGTVMEQLDILGTQIVPVLRREFESLRPAGVPSDPPKHAELRVGQAVGRSVMENC